VICTHNVERSHSTHSRSDALVLVSERSRNTQLRMNMEKISPANYPCEKRNESVSFIWPLYSWMNDSKPACKWEMWLHWQYYEDIQREPSFRSVPHSYTSPPNPSQHHLLHHQQLPHGYKDLGARHLPPTQQLWTPHHQPQITKPVAPSLLALLLRLTSVTLVTTLIRCSFIMF